MNRQQKTDVVEFLKNNFEHSQAAFVVGFRGLTVAQMQTLRRELRKKGGSMKVTKARLMKRAAQDAHTAEVLLPYFKDQIGLVFAGKDSPAVAKVLESFSKEAESFRLIAGCLEESFVDGSGIVRIASLPPREVLLAHLCGTLKSPITRLAGACSMLTTKLLWTLKQIEQQKK
jgi:large subunit ribosomal protein L10